jgi:hypothetical protein
MLVRRVVRNWLFEHPSPLVESASVCQNQQKELGFNNENRKQGDEYSLCGLPGVFKTRIHVIIVRSSGHHINAAPSIPPPTTRDRLQEEIRQGPDERLDLRNRLTILLR